MKVKCVNINLENSLQKIINVSNKKFDAGVIHASIIVALHKFLCKGKQNTFFYCKDFRPCCEYRGVKPKQTLALKTHSD